LYVIHFPGFEHNRKMKILIPGLFKKIAIHMSWQKFQFIFIQGISVSASADIDISKVDVYFNAEMCLTGDGCSLQIQTFDIKEIGHIDVNIHGLGPLDWILGTVVGFVADLIRDFLADVLEGPIKDLLQGILNDLMP